MDDRKIDPEIVEGIIVTLIEKLTKTREGMRLYQQERSIQELTDMICEIMNKENVSCSELAKRLGKTEVHIRQLLDGGMCMDIRMISDIFTALDRVILFQEGPLPQIGEINGS